MAGEPGLQKGVAGGAEMIQSVGYPTDFLPADAQDGRGLRKREPSSHATDRNYRSGCDPRNHRAGCSFFFGGAYKNKNIAASGAMRPAEISIDSPNSLIHSHLVMD